MKEAEELFKDGYREVTMLGQNVDSYLWHGGGLKKDLDPEVVVKALDHNLTAEEQKRYVTFADLIERVALIHPDLRVRFSTSNPRDMTDAVLHVMARYENVCKYVHLPVQSGSTRMLDKMNRGYTREQYIERINSIRKIIPECGISTDVISGFCTETEEDHLETISLMEWVKYDFAYMFTYSERPGTLAARNYSDDVLEPVKKKRLAEILVQQQLHSASRTKNGLGKVHRVLIEGLSKKSADFYYGRNSQNTVVVFPKEQYQIGSYVNVLAESCTLATLIGKVVQ